MATVTRLDIVPAPPSNNARMEFLFSICEGLPPARQKRLIVQAGQIGILEDGDAEIMIDALGLRAE